MAFSINQFKSNSTGYLSPSKFELIFAGIPPKVMNVYKTYVGAGDTTNIADQLKFTCEASLLPGVAMNVHQVRTNGYGINETRPVHPIYQKLNLSLYSDSDAKIWKFFNSWLSLIANHGTPEKSWTTIKSDGSGLKPYQISYRDEYAINIAELKQYDNNGNEKISVKMNYTFPIVLGDIQLNWGLSSQIMRIPVVLSYFDWYTSTTSPSNTTASSNTIYGASSVSGGQVVATAY